MTMNRADAMNMSLDDMISAGKSSKKSGGEKKAPKPKDTPKKEFKGKTTSRETAVNMSLDDMITSDRKSDRKGGKGKGKGGKGKGKETEGSSGRVKLTAAPERSRGLRTPKGGKGKGRRYEWDDDWDERPSARSSKGKGKGAGKGKGKGKGRGKGGVSGGYRLKIVNLDYSIMVHEMEELFGSIPGLQQVWIDYDASDRSTGTGGAVFQTYRGVERAMQYDGQKIEGLKLRLREDDDAYPNLQMAQIKNFSTEDDGRW